MSKTLQVIDSPIGELEWVFIDGDGKPDLQGVPKYQVDLVLEPEVAEAFREKVMSFWEENKPKGAKEPKSTGLYPHKVKDEKASSEAGENVYTDTGKTVVRFKTNTQYQNGDPKVVKVFNSKGSEISLMGKKIGNGSRGRVNGAMDIYNVPSGKGVTFYLNGVQLSKFVEFTGGVNFDELEDPDGEEFEGVPGNMGGIDNEEANNETERPRL